MIVSDSMINRIFKGYVSGLNAIKSKALVESVINKLDDWADNLPGNNYEAREQVFASGFVQITAENTQIKELDLLALRQVLKSVNKSLKLTKWELLVAYILFVSLDDMNDLLLDQEFLLTSNRDFKDTEDDRKEKVEFIE